MIKNWEFLARGKVHGSRMRYYRFLLTQAQYIPPSADATQLLSWVWTHPSAVVTQFTSCCAVELLRLMSRDDKMTSLLKKLSISIKIQVVYSQIKPLWSLFGQFPKLSTESIGSRRELVANSVHTADADATQLVSWVGVYWASYY